MLSGLVIGLLLTSDQVTLKSGPLADVAYEVFSQTKEPVVIGMEGAMPQATRVNYDPSKDEGNGVFFKAIGEGLGLDVVTKNGSMVLAPPMFPSPYPRESVYDLYPPVDNRILQRLERVDDTLVLKQATDSKVKSGIVLTGGQISQILKDIDISWFLHDFRVTVAFDQISTEQLAKMFAHATCGVYKPADEEKEEPAKVEVDLVRFKEMWLQKLQDKFDQTARLSEKARIQTSIDLLMALDNQQLKELVSKPKAFVYVDYSPGTDGFNVAVDLYRYLRTAPDFVGTIHRDEEVDMVEERYADVDWMHPVRATYMATEQSFLMLRSKSEKAWILP